MAENKLVSRRDFLKASAGVAAFTIVPSHVLGGQSHTPPSEKVNIACVGVYGMGGANLRNCEGENIVALCDVDDNKAADVYNKYPNAKKYRDYRKMLESQKDIDAVIVATPDHTHACIAMAAIEMGKHVYVQKPLTHSVYEARKLKEAAKQYKVVTQMGNQGHSGEGARVALEWLRAGVVGQVKEIKAWTNRPIWPQGIDRPEGTPTVPDGLDWDLWLGPAPERPYHPAYHPFKWRGFWDFGTGALGDMGCHILDTAYWGFELDNPISMEAISTPVNNETAPIASVVKYEFGQRGKLPPISFTWYDGNIRPSLPECIETGRRLGDDDGGSMFIGEKGALVAGTYGGSPVIYPAELRQEFKRPEKSIPRIPGGKHEQDWIDAIKNNTQACSNFDYACGLTEMILLGNLAIRAQRKVYWDGENMKATNLPDGDMFIKRDYRQGWTL